MSWQRDIPARTVFHVGYPKTGTTTLQMRVFPHHPELQYLGKRIPGYGYATETLGWIVNEITFASELLWDPSPRLEATLAQLRGSGTGTMLISSESFIHPGSACPVQVAERLARQLPSAEILMTLRSQQGILESFYRNHGSFGAFTYLAKNEDESLRLPLTPEQWLTLQFRAPHKSILDTLHFDAMIECYERLFGAERVYVLLYEQLASDPAAYGRQLGEALGIDGERCAQLIGNHRDNAGLDPASFNDIARRAAGPITLFRDGGMDPSPNTAQPPVPVTFPAPWQERVDALYAAGNARLAARRGLALGALGYPV